MKFSVIPFVSGVAALGINCRGSGVCSFNDASLQVVRDQIGNLIADGGGDRRFGTGRECTVLLHDSCGRADTL
jgi:hypothetical protein